MERRKKLNLKVKWELQRWLLWRIFLTVLVAISIALVILYLFSHREIGQSLYKAHLTIKHVSDLLLPVILASGGICLVAGLLIAIFLPQKIAGPIYRIEQDLRYVAEKRDLTKKVSLRRGDRFQSLASAANVVIDTVREDMSKILNDINGLDKALKEGKVAEAQKYLEAVKKRIGNYKLN